MAYYITNTPNGAFLIDMNDIIGNTIWKTGQWEPTLESFYRSIVKSDYLAVNVGANLGYHTIKLGIDCDKVIAFEPQRKIYNQLCSNIYLNELDEKIEVYRLALGDLEENKNLSSFENNPNSVCGELKNYGGISFLDDGNGESVKVTTLDSFNLNPDFILIDAERYEYEVLKGSTETLARSKPIILVEIWDIHKNKIFHHLKSLGYEIYWKPQLVDNFIFLHSDFKDYIEIKEKLKEDEFYELYFTHDKCNIE